MHESIEFEKKDVLIPKIKHRKRKGKNTMSSIDFTIMVLIAFL